MWRWSVLLVVPLVALWPGRALACEGCAGPLLLDARGTPEGLLPGELALVVNLGGAWLEERRPVADGGAPAPDTDTAFLEARPVLTLGFSHRWSLELQVPLRYALTSGPGGEAGGGGPGGRGAFGFGDPALSARLALPVFAWTVVGSLGATLPLGHSAGLDEDGLPATPLGTGTVNPIASIEATRTLGPVWMRATVLAFVPLYANAENARARGRVQGSLMAELPVSRRWLLGGGFDVLQELPGRSAISSEAERSRTRAFLGASARLWLGAWSARLTVKAAPWERGGGAETAMPVSGGLAFETRFDVGT